MNRYIIECNKKIDVDKHKGEFAMGVLVGEVVRCEGCKHWEESQYFQEFMVCTYVKGATFTRQHDDFCSRGERKESE